MENNQSVIPTPAPKQDVMPAGEGDIPLGYKKFIHSASLDYDEVTMVLRTHLLIEYYLDHIIILKIPRGDLITDRFSFSEKLLVIEALNIMPREMVDAVRGLNNIRNQCSHNLDYQISESDVDKIGRPFGKEYLEIKSDHFQNNRTLLHWLFGCMTAKINGFIDAMEKPNN